MGGGTYCTSSASLRSSTAGYATKSTREVFKQRNINNAMNPLGLGIRESRDSEEHPESVAIIIALDVTGSMGSIPHHLISEGLPTIMEKIMQSGIKDPQVLFLGIGDHECDSSPLQVGQFESSDELLDHWLKTVYLEGGGGGNDGESYLLAWYLAAKHTSIDCFSKRNQKGFLFTIGDEPTLRGIPKSAMDRIVGKEVQSQSWTAEALLEKAREKYNVKHIHTLETWAGSRYPMTQAGWKQLLKDDLLVVNNTNEIADVIAKTIVEGCRKVEAQANLEVNVEANPVVENKLSDGIL